MTLSVESSKVYTSQGVPISVTGIAQVKVQSQNEDMLMVSESKGTKILMVLKFECIPERLRTIFGEK